MTNFTDREKTVILAALLTVSPSGGGSESHALYRRLCDTWRIDHADDALNNLMSRFANTILDDAVECGAVKWRRDTLEHFNRTRVAAGLVPRNVNDPNIVCD